MEKESQGKGTRRIDLSTNFGCEGLAPLLAPSPFPYHPTTLCTPRAHVPVAHLRLCFSRRRPLLPIFSVRLALQSARCPLRPACDHAFSSMAISPCHRPPNLVDGHHAPRSPPHHSVCVATGGQGAGVSFVAAGLWSQRCKPTLLVLVVPAFQRRK